MRTQHHFALALALATASAACAAGDQVQVVKKNPDGTETASTVPVASASSFCAALCERQESCDRTLDRQTCENACRNQNAAVFPRLRQDVVGNILTCVDEKDCKTVLSGGLVGACATEAVARVAPSDAAVAYCSAFTKAMEKCGSTGTKAACLEGAKLYSDDAIAEAQNCTSRACSEMSACVSAVFGGFGTSATKSPGGGGSSCRSFPEYGSCRSCAEGACCAEASACAADSQCSTLMQYCTSSSGSSSCYSMYQGMSSSSQQLAGQFFSCAQTSCSSTCSPGL